MAEQETYLERQWTNLDGQWANSKHSNLDESGEIHVSNCTKFQSVDHLVGHSQECFLNVPLNSRQ